MAKKVATAVSAAPDITKIFQNVSHLSALSISGLDIVSGGALDQVHKLYRLQANLRLHSVIEFFGELPTPICMTEFQIWTLVIAALALGVSSLAYVNAVRARKISAEAVETSKQSLAVSQESLSISERQSTPRLTFSCDTLIDGASLIITLIISNSGREATMIEFGKAVFQSKQYPNADKAYPLKGVQIPGGGQHKLEFRVKRATVDGTAGGPGGGEVLCDASYTTGPRSSRGDIARFAYSREHQKFLPYEKSFLGQS